VDGGGKGIMAKDFKLPQIKDKYLDYFVYMLEQYSEYKRVPGSEMLKLWDEKGVTQLVKDNYVMYHQEAITNAFKEIDHFIETGELLY
jgi:hypothetical protein